jgi:hypothetical protein
MARLVLIDSAEMSWRVLIDDERGRRAALDIVEAIEALPVSTQGLSGSAGRALMCSYAAAAADGAQADALTAQATAHLDHAVAALADMRGVSLWGGVSGVRFAIAHLAGGDEAAEVLAVIDEAVAGVLAAPWADTYDLISGLVGIGVAALEGAPNRAVIARAIAQLAALAERDGAHATWFTPPQLLPDWQRALCPGGYHNVGLAHGVPGVIGFLAAVIEHDLDDDGHAAALLRGAVGWLEAAVPERAPRRFPAWLAPEADRAPSKAAWCYGDAGVAIVLLRAARALRDQAMEARALATARSLAALAIADSGVIDTALCHGAAGVAHILNRLYQATDDPAIGAAARRWYGQLIELRRPGVSIGGFQVVRGHGGDVAWVDDADLLAGLGGVALALLAATSPVEPAWDRLLLCDLAPTEAG